MEKWDSDWEWPGRKAAAGDTVTILDIDSSGPWGEREVTGRLVSRGPNFGFVLVDSPPADRELWEVDIRSGWSQGTFVPDDVCGVIIGDDWPDGIIEEVLADGRLRIAVPDRGEYLVTMPDFRGVPVEKG